LHHGELRKFLRMSAAAADHATMRSERVAGCDCLAVGPQSRVLIRERLARRSIGRGLRLFGLITYLAEKPGRDSVSDEAPRIQPIPLIEQRLATLPNSRNIRVIYERLYRMLEFIDRVPVDIEAPIQNGR